MISDDLKVKLSIGLMIGLLVVVFLFAAFNPQTENAHGKESEASETHETSVGASEENNVETESVERDASESHS